MNRSYWVAHLVLATAIALALGTLHYILMQPTAGATFSVDGVSPQHRVARAHLMRAVPIAFVVILGIAFVGAMGWIRNPRQSLPWVAIGGIAGAAGFTAAAPFVPLTGPWAGPDYTGRVVTVVEVTEALIVGGVVGLLGGAVAAIGQYGLTKRCS